MALPPSDGSYEIDCHAVASELREAMTKTEAVSDERLRDLIVAIEDAGLLLHDDMIDAAKAVRELLSRRAANSAGGVEVKALEWRVNGNGWCADTPFGPYDFSQYGSRWAVYLSGGLIAEPENKEACERIAQADFNQRILSAISLDTNKGDGV